MKKQIIVLNDAESYALCIAQWCIFSPLNVTQPKNVFFSQIRVEEVEVKDLKRIPLSLNNNPNGRKIPIGFENLELDPKKKYKAINLEATFTVLDGNLSNDNDVRSHIEVQVIFKDLGLGFNIWDVYACHVILKNYDENSNFSYNSVYLQDPEVENGRYLKLANRERKFMDFFKILLRSTNSWSSAEKIINS